MAGVDVLEVVGAKLVQLVQLDGTQMLVTSHNTCENSLIFLCWPMGSSSWPPGRADDLSLYGKGTDATLNGICCTVPGVSVEAQAYRAVDASGVRDKSFRGEVCTSCCLIAKNRTAPAKLAAWTCASRAHHHRLPHPQSWFPRKAQTRTPYPVGWDGAAELQSTSLESLVWQLSSRHRKPFHHRLLAPPFARGSI